MDGKRTRRAAQTRRNRGDSIESIIALINPILCGWFGYFQHAHRYTFSSVDGFVRRRLRAILRRQLRPSPLWDAVRMNTVCPAFRPPAGIGIGLRHAHYADFLETVPPVDRVEELPAQLPRLSRVHQSRDEQVGTNSG